MVHGCHGAKADEQVQDHTFPITLTSCSSNSALSFPSSCKAWMSSDPPMESPFRSTFGTVPRSVRRDRICLIVAASAGRKYG